MPKYNLGKAVINKANIPTFTPQILFARGEQGAWYDPSDFSTLYQDSTGTTPVTALGQPVGLMLDKSGNGNHAAQATAAARPTVQARVNLLERTEEFDQDPPWNPTGSSVTANSITAPDGTTTADKLVEDNSNGGHRLTSDAVSVVDNTQYTVSFYAKAGERTKCAVGLISSSTYAYIFDLQNGTLVQSAGVAPDDQSITAIGDGWYRCSITATTLTTSANARVYVIDANNNLDYQGDGTSGIYLWGAQLELGSTATTYQRVTTATDYQDIGLPRYLEFDGVDDFMTAGAAGDWNYLHDGTGATTVIGVVPSSSGGASNGVMFATFNGATSTVGFRFDYISSNERWLTQAVRGVNGEATFTLISTNNAASPTTDGHIVSVIHGSAQTPDVLLRSDGNADSSTAYGYAPSTADSTAELYLAQLSAGAVRGNPRIYQIIIRGATTAGALLDQTEAFVARKTGVTL